MTECPMKFIAAVLKTGVSGALLALAISAQAESMASVTDPAPIDGCMTDVQCIVSTSALATEGVTETNIASRGWPQRISTATGLYAAGIAAIAADLDNDDDLEVIGCSLDGNVRVWDHEGLLQPGWPYHAPGTGGLIKSSPACVDLDGDGDLEIILPVITAGIMVWHHDGSTLSGWPKTFAWPQRPFGSASVGNLDDDPEWEIVAAVNDPLTLYVWNADGTLVPGWPREFPEDWHSMATPALVDIDEDDIDEIVFVRLWAGSPNGSAVHIMNAMGVDLPGWPVSLPGATYSSAAVGDLDDDGDLEILVSSGVEQTMLDLGGAVQPGWPFAGTASLSNASPTIGGFAGGGPLAELKIAAANICSDQFIFVSDGSISPGWPVQRDGCVISNILLPSPIIADIDGDGVGDVVMPTPASEKLWAWSHTGEDLPGWPHSLPGDTTYQTNYGSAMVADLDLDEDVEVLCASGDGYLHVWDLAAPYNSHPGDWPSLHHDLRNSRYLARPVMTGVIAEGTTAPGARLYDCSPNPFNPSTRVTYRLQEVARVELTVVDPSGRTVRELEGGVRTAGLQTARWDGRDDRGTRCPSGVYSIRLEVGGESLTRKVVLLK